MGQNDCGTIILWALYVNLLLVSTGSDGAFRFRRSVVPLSSDKPFFLKTLKLPQSFTILFELPGLQRSPSTWYSNSPAWSPTKGVCPPFTCSLAIPFFVPHNGDGVGVTQATPSYLRPRSTSAPPTTRRTLPVSWNFKISR